MTEGDLMAIERRFAEAQEGMGGAWDMYCGHNKPGAADDITALIAEVRRLHEETNAKTTLRSMAPHQDGPFNQAWEVDFSGGGVYSKTRWNEERGTREVLGPDGNWHAY